MKHTKELIEQKLVEIESLKRTLKILKKKRKNNLIDADTLDKTKGIFQKTSKVVQYKLEDQLSKTTTSAIKAVFPDEDYHFKASFVERRNTTECDMLLAKSKKYKKPLESDGYGVADIISLSLWVSFWKLESDVSNTLIVDEPTRNLSQDRQIHASTMLKKLSEQGIQFIIVTHRKELAEMADKIFHTNETGIQEISREELDNVII